MSRGGSRPNSGRKSLWKNTPTQTIRVPAALAEQLLEIAHELDEDEISGSVPESNFENVSKSKSSIDSDTEPEKVIEFVTKSFAISTSALSERFGIPRNTMKRHIADMTGAELAEYTREHDPDGFAWERCDEPAMFRPILELP